MPDIITVNAIGDYDGPPAALAPDGKPWPSHAFDPPRPAGEPGSGMLAGQGGTLDLGLRCHATLEGECQWNHCPQVRDGEPMHTGRTCPLPWMDEEQ
jgi:hypothetical protein